ncbi:MAG: hypothetical protein QM813_21665 [Verrucomicrobiota bacterium]
MFRAAGFSSFDLSGEPASFYRDGFYMTNLPVNLDTLQHAKQKVVDLSIEFGPKVFTALLILAAGFFVARWIGGLFQRWLEKLHLEAASAPADAAGRATLRHGDFSVHGVG